MKSFFKSYFAALLAGITLFMLGFIFLLALGGSKDNSIAEDSMLRIEFSGIMQDYVPRTEFPSLQSLLSNERIMSMEEIVFSLYKAADDPKITGVYLDLDIFTAGTAQLREIREALAVFKESGKPVYAYATILTRQSYYVGSAADSLWLSPTGLMEWNGLASSQPYLKGALDRLGIKMNLIRGSDNAYKSAGEPLIADEMSDANRAQISSYINSIWDNTLADLEGDGRVTAADLDRLADSGILVKPEDALAYGLIDELLYEDEMRSRLNWTEDFSPMVSVGKYDQQSSFNGSALERVAVIYAEGEVALGKSSQGTMGSETIVQALREVRNRESIKAVVLRINSPGGVSLAGDAMWREIQLLREVKPVIVSMGNVAASAGYQIAAPADTIMASPQTITGSIGVFMLFPTAEELMHEHLGIKFESVKTNEFGDFGTIDRPLTDAEYNILQGNVDDFYNHFKDQVANGRGLDRSYVDSIARGRVWTGAQGLENGLVDLEGGLMDAITLAGEMAGIEGRPGVSSYPLPQDPFEEFINNMSSSQSEAAISEQLGPLAPVYHQWKKIEPMMGTQKRLVEYSMEQPL